MAGARSHGEGGGQSETVRLAASTTCSAHAPPQRYPQRFNYFSSRTFAATQVRVATTERHQRSAKRFGKRDGVVGFVSVPARGPSAKHLSQRKGFTTGSALGCKCLPSLPGGNATTG